MKRKHTITLDTSLCVRCGLCAKDCVAELFTVTDKGVKTDSPESMNLRCIGCGHCVAICPKNAISMSDFADEPEPLSRFMRPDPDSILGLIKSRRSMRFFTAEDISPETIALIIEAGRYTPTGSNKQTVSYAILREGKDECEEIAVQMLRRLKRLIDLFTKKYRNHSIDDNFFFKQAPVVIVIKSTDVVDGALAASSMELMAQSLNLGVLYSGFFTHAVGLSRRLRRMLSVMPREKVIATLVIGHPAITYQRTAQRENPNIVYC
jgi:ferredoxin